MSEPERIAKRLARAGLCSRRDAERWIAAQSERPDVEAAIHAEVSAEAKMPSPPFASPSVA